jgi:hypothetical protein
MNKIKFLAIYILLICFSCGTQDKGTVFTTSATIFLINETDVVVKSDDILGYIIQPGDTLIRTETLTNDFSEKPNINNYDPLAVVEGSRVFIYGNNSECEFGLTDIKNYEDRKEINPLVFEFTFRFTEEKKANSSPCNL